jgi:hypothetical protein
MTSDVIQNNTRSFLAVGPTESGEKRASNFLRHSECHVIKSEADSSEITLPLLLVVHQLSSSSYIAFSLTQTTYSHKVVLWSCEILVVGGAERSFFEPVSQHLKS